MIRNLKDLSKRFFISNKWITFSSIIAISLSTLLITLLMNFSINSENKLRKETLDKFGTFQILCGYDIGSEMKITQNFIDKVSELGEVEKLSPAITNNIKINGIDTYTLGVENDDLSKSRYGYINNIEEDTIAINKQLANSLKVKIGDNILVNNYQKKVMEIFEDKTYSSNSINMAIIRRSEFKKILNLSQEASFIMVKVKNDNDISKVSEELLNLDKNLRVDVFQEDEQLKSNVNSMKYFIGFLGSLVFVMCGIFIVSNLQGYIYKYTKDFAIMKAIGGASFQVFITILLQTIMMNIIGVFSGIMLSILICKMFLSSFEYYILQSLQIAGMGFIIIQIVLLIPAFRTARILPIKAMTNNNDVEFKHLKLMKFIMRASIISGVFLVLDSILLNESDSFIYGIIGFLFTYLSFFLFVLIYIKRILSLLIKPLKIVIGTVGEVSAKMLIHQVKKSPILILAITTMMIITTIGGSFVKLITFKNENYYRSEYLTDIVLKSDNELDYKETINILNSINEIDDTVASVITEGGTAHLINNNDSVTFVLGNLTEMKKQGLIKNFDGKVENKVILNEKYAKDKNIKIGDKLKFASFERQANVIYADDDETKSYQYTLEVSSIESDKVTNTANVLIDIKNSDMAQGRSGILSKMYIDTTNRNIDVLLSNIKKQYPSIKWASLEKVLSETNKAIEERWKYFQLALIIINFIILFGIIVSIKSNINSNRKQYALLRCMKFKQKDLRKMILTQSIVFQLLGQILGIILGTMGAFIVTMSDGGNKFIPPDYVTLILICIFSIIVTVLCILKDIRKIEKEKLIEELNQEEL